MLATVVVLFVAKELKIVTVPEMSRDIPRKVRDNLPDLKKTCQTHFFYYVYFLR